MAGLSSRVLVAIAAAGCVVFVGCVAVIVLELTTPSASQFIITPAAALKQGSGSHQVVIMYTVFGDFLEEHAFEFERLVRHVTGSPALRKHDVVLLWETDTPVDAAASPYTFFDGLTHRLAGTPAEGRVKVTHAVGAEGQAVYPPAVFRMGLYGNPEVAVIQYLRNNPGMYQHVWLLESDVRWTGHWATLLSQPYSSSAPVDLFVFRTDKPWRYRAPGWETSGCGVPLSQYPKGFFARSQNRTVGLGPWGDRIACLMPAKRLSAALLATLDDVYRKGQGGYAEVAIPTINANTHRGSFGTAAFSCMHYSFKDPNATTLYEEWRDSGADVSPNPCLLHPVKATRWLSKQ